MKGDFIMKRLLVMLFIVTVLLSSCAVKVKDTSSNSRIDESQTDGVRTVINISWVPYQNATELVDEADVIFTGTVIGKKYVIHKTESDKISKIWPYTEYSVKIKTVYKGEAKYGVKVYVLGIPENTKVDNYNINEIPTICDAPTIEIGETYLFTLKDRENLGLEAITFYQGALNIRKPDAKEGSLPTVNDILAYLKNK